MTRNDILKIIIERSNNTNKKEFIKEEDAWDYIFNLLKFKLK